MRRIRLRVDAMQARRVTSRLHIGVARAHILVEGWLGEGKSLLQACSELGLTRHQRGGSEGGKLGLAQGHQPSRSEHEQVHE